MCSGNRLLPVFGDKELPQKILIIKYVRSIRFARVRQIVRGQAPLFKIDRQRIDAIPLSGFRWSVVKYMSEMTATIRA